MVSGASGLIGYGILKSIRMSEIPYNLIGNSVYGDSVAPGFCDVFIKSPLVTDEGYISWVISVIDAYKIDLLIPSFEDDVIVMKDNIDQLLKTGVKVVLNKIDLISLCDDKWKFYQTLKTQNSPYAIPSSLSSDFDEVVDEFNLPLLLKPRKGSASRGIIKVFDKESFIPHIDKIGSSMMVQPLIGQDDQEFTASAFGDGNGGFWTIMTLKRKLSRQGYTEKAEVVEVKEIEDAVASLCKIFMPIGPTNFQFRMHEDKYYLLEINPRISSATSIRSSFGYNEPIMAVEYYLEGKIPKQPTISKGKAVRYIEDFIFHE